MHNSFISTQLASYHPIFLLKLPPITRDQRVFLRVVVSLLYFQEQRPDRHQGSRVWPFLLFKFFLHLANSAPSLSSHFPGAITWVCLVLLTSKFFLKHLNFPEALLFLGYNPIEAEFKL